MKMIVKSNEGLSTCRTSRANALDMAFLRSAWAVSMGAALVIGCDGPTGNGSGGGGAGPSSTSGATGGSGGSVTTTTSMSTTTTTSSSTTTTKPLDPSGFSCSGASPTMADVVAITSKHCSEGMGCHVAMTTGNGVYDQMVNRIAEQCVPEVRLMVEPGNAERSYVIHKMTNHNICTGQTMPKDLALLPAKDIQVIYDWICVGAPNP